MGNLMIGVTLSLYFSVYVLYFLSMLPKKKDLDEKLTAVGKVIAITGAISEIGKELALQLNIKGGKIYIFCPSAYHTFSLLSTFIRSDCECKRIDFIECDLTNLSSIKESVKEFKKKEAVLDILINNASIVYYPKFVLTIDQCELMWQTNYLGHFVLTELLTPLLKRSKGGGRIINISSKLESSCKEIDLKRINSSDYFDEEEAYKRSKLAQIMHAIEYTRRKRSADPDTKITINSCEPGIVETNLFRDLMLEASCINITNLPLSWFFSQTPNDCAQCPLFLALSKKVASISGKHFVNCSEKHEINIIASDANKCSELYDYSMQYI
ncbi:Dehydrogenase/reductase SDR family member on chromosome X [Strongyloides ratti]|uniref:Dehydrogenase/reductase SDR family member on chromosome X n=1 Tax=Strongyloides ratti TaxID=34506 RepID=A0A090LNG8_STRRB|nr:Dehydrogenase/reductase SDR family member on chromosome X [Strongyloides ratti]CEF69080.1 Dehydrogenase/reductase SDR family member on chromosome X [Strongyloides ratti]